MCHRRHLRHQGHQGVHRSPDCNSGAPHGLCVLGRRGRRACRWRAGSPGWRRGSLRSRSACQTRSRGRGIGVLTTHSSGRADPRRQIQALGVAHGSSAISNPPRAHRRIRRLCALECSAIRRKTHRTIQSWPTRQLAWCRVAVSLQGGDGVLRATASMLRHHESALHGWRSADLQARRRHCRERRRQVSRFFRRAQGWAAIVERSKGKEGACRRIAATSGRNPVF